VRLRVTHKSDPGSPTNGRLSAVLVERARTQAPVPLRVACGLGGGGEALARALLAVVDAQDVLGEACVSSSRNSDPATIAYATSGGVVIDQVGGSDVGPLPPSKAERDGPGWSLVLVRDRAHGACSLAAFAGPDAERRQFCDLLRDECAIPEELAASVSDRLGCPTALIPELRELRGDWSEASARELVEACWTLPLMVRLREHTLRRGGRALIDLGRVLCLMRPPEIELSDEWALLASALSTRSYATSDVSLAVNACLGLFDVRRAGERTLVRPSSPLASHILLDGIQPSASEHLALYRALRDRCVGRASHRDRSDRFIARQLPRQARAADALSDLAADPLGILHSDPITLLRELEAQPKQLRAPGRKMISLAAHRLMGGDDRDSQLELSARRMGLHELADRLASQTPARRWRPLWAQAQLPNVHRVALNHRAPLLALAAMDDHEGSVFVGCADGEVWCIKPYRNAICLSGSQGLDGEIRAIAACSLDDQRLVAVGTSTHAIGVLDGASGELQWLDRRAHHDPLSAVAISAGDLKVLISAGVGGLIYAHPLQAGEGRGKVLYAQGSEIRGLQVVRLGMTDLVVFSAVDGCVGLVRCTDGVLVAKWHLGEEVLNAVAASTEGGSLRLVTGTSEGNVRQLRLPVEALEARREVAATEPRTEEWQIVANHRGAVNSVRLVQERDSYAVLSGASDGLWQWHDGQGMHQSGVGHVGPIWSIACTATGRRRYVVSAGGEGSCRLWLIEAVLGERIERTQPLARRSPVTAIGLAGDPTERMRLITGGDDGDVRIVAPELTDGGELLARHDGEISSLLSIALDEPYSHVISGSVDGTLRLTPIDPSRSRESSILGIAHDGVTTLARGGAGSDRYIISGGSDGTISLWDLHLRTPERTVQASRYGGVQALCHIHERSEAMLLVGGQDGQLVIFHPLDLKKRVALPLDAGVLCMCPLPGPLAGVIAGLDDGRMAVVREPRVKGRRGVSYFEVSDNEIRGIGTLLLGGRIFVACAGLDRRMRLLDLQTGAHAIDIELDGFALSLSTVGTAVGVGTSAGAAVISYATDILALLPNA
jgi:WD40 repeat protein